MTNEYWQPTNKSNPFEKDAFVEMLTKSDISFDVATEVANQISMVDKDENNIIFIFTDNNDYVVTGIHVPVEALNGNPGPVLMRGGNDKAIIAAFSRDFIAERLEKVDLEEEKTGLHRASDILWVNELENLAEMVRVELLENPPENWDELLDGEQ